MNRPTRQQEMELWRLQQQLEDEERASYGPPFPSSPMYPREGQPPSLPRSPVTAFPRHPPPSMQMRAEEEEMMLAVRSRRNSLPPPSTQFATLPPPAMGAPSSSRYPIGPNSRNQWSSSDPAARRGLSLSSYDHHPHQYEPPPSFRSIEQQEAAARAASSARRHHASNSAGDSLASVPRGGASTRREDDPAMLRSLLQQREEMRYMNMKRRSNDIPPESWLPASKRPRMSMPPGAAAASGMEPIIPWPMQGGVGAGPSHHHRANINPYHMMMMDSKPQKKPRKRHVDTFPVKLMDTITDNRDNSIFAWLPDGKSVVVVDKDRFINEVLANTFKGGKYSSFVRKLNRWGFSRLISGTGMDCFHHRLFQRDRPELCTLITNGGKDDTFGVDPALIGGKPSLAGIEKYFATKVSAIIKTKEEEAKEAAEATAAGRVDMNATKEESSATAVVDAQQAEESKTASTAAPAATTTLNTKDDEDNQEGTQENAQGDEVKEAATETVEPSSFTSGETTTAELEDKTAPPPATTTEGELVQQ